MGCITEIGETRVSIVNITLLFWIPNNNLRRFCGREKKKIAAIGYHVFGFTSAPTESRLHTLPKIF